MTTDEIVFNWLRSGEPEARTMLRHITHLMPYLTLFREPTGILGVLCRLGWLDVVDPQLFEDETQ